MVNLLSDTELHEIWKRWKANGGNLQRSGPLPEKPPVPTVEESQRLIEAMIDEIMDRQPPDRRAGIDPETRKKQDRLLDELMRR